MLPVCGVRMLYGPAARASDATAPAFAAAIAVVIFLQGLKGDLPRPDFRLEEGEGRRLVVEGLLILTLPVVIIRGASSGVFTSTEAGGVACLYALLLGFFVFRQLTPRAVWQCLVVTAQISASIYLVLAASELMSWVLTRGGITDYVRDFGELFGGNKLLFLLALALALWLHLALEETYGR